MHSNVFLKTRGLKKESYFIIILAMLFFVGLNPLLAQSKPDPKALIKQVDDPTSRKFSHSSMKENLQNTKAKNSDFTLSTFAEDYTVTKMTDGMVGKFPVWILDLKAKTNEVAYDRVVLYIRKDRTMLLKREDYSVNGRLMRTTAYPKYVELEGRLLPSQILIVDEVNKGEKSQITMAEQSVSPLPDRVFTKAFLEQVSR